MLPHSIMYVSMSFVLISTCNTCCSMVIDYLVMLLYIAIVTDNAHLNERNPTNLLLHTFPLIYFSSNIFFFMFWTSELRSICLWQRCLFLVQEGISDFCFLVTVFLHPRPIYLDVWYWQPKFQVEQLKKLKHLEQLWDSSELCCWTASWQ